IDLLSLISFFNLQGILKSILRRYSISKIETGDKDNTSSAFNKDLNTLQLYFLIVVTIDRSIYKMHALV
ncbi:hypothetical protein GQ44DRAFT_627002, partial [Phaeosphaeriaceae sp. PMI808]